MDRLAGRGSGDGQGCRSSEGTGAIQGGQSRVSRVSSGNMGMKMSWKKSEETMYIYIYVCTGMCIFYSYIYMCTQVH